MLSWRRCCCNGNRRGIAIISISQVCRLFHRQRAAWRWTSPRFRNTLRAGACSCRLGCGKPMLLYCLEAYGAIRDPCRTTSAPPSLPRTNVVSDRGQHLSLNPHMKCTHEFSPCFTPMHRLTLCLICRRSSPPLPQSLVNVLNVVRRRLTELEGSKLYTQEDVEHYKARLKV